jgi:hypothetical protein
MAAGEAGGQNGNVVPQISVDLDLRVFCCGVAALR